VKFKEWALIILLDVLQGGDGNTRKKMERREARTGFPRGKPRLRCNASLQELI